MKKVLLLVLAACSSPGLSYQENDLELLTHYRAKELCSCVFVMKMDEAYCNAWTVADPNIASVRVDRKAQRVEADAVVLWSASAHYVSERFGCVLD